MKVVADYDDDDISQHEVMVPHSTVVTDTANSNNSTATSSSTNSTTTIATTAAAAAAANKGYRRIEEWHNDNHDPQHVLKSLQQEQAKWKRKFEDLGGDGI